MNDLKLDLESMAASIFDQVGLTELVGGPSVVRAGFHEIKGGLFQVAADLATAKTRGDGLWEAVFDTVSYPHLARFHGFLRDVLVMPWPEEMRPFVEKLVSSPSPSPVSTIRRWLVQVAVHSAEIGHKLLAEFMIFEAFCLNQRVHLRRAGGHIEALNGRRSDVERIAAVELEALLTDPEYVAGLSELEDPWPVLMSSAFVTLSDHVNELRQAAAGLQGHIREELRLRNQLLERLDRLPPDAAVLIRPQYSDLLGEERLSIEQLQVMHSLLLGSASRNSLDKRVERLKKKGGGLEHAEPRPPSLLDYLLKSEREQLK